VTPVAKHGPRSDGGPAERAPESPPRPARGSTLQDLLARGALDPARALELLGQVAEALDAAHSRGIVLPNSGPASVRIDEEHGGRAVVDHSPGEEELQYVSPERILGRAQSASSSVYSLSALLYHCLTGTVPFPRGHERAVLFWHLHAPRPRPTVVRRDLPAAIDSVIARGMAIDPAARPATARALIDDARRALAVKRREPDAGVEEPLWWAAQPARRMRATLVPLGLIVALAVVGGAAGLMVGGAGDDSQRTPVASVGRLELAVPAGWRRSGEQTSAPNLGLADVLVLVPSQSLGSRLIAGIARPSDSVTLLAQLEASRAAGELVSLGSVKAWRYRAAELPDGAGPVTLYAAPMDHGVATVACVAESRAGASDFMPRCERVVTSMRLASGRFTPVRLTARQAMYQARVFRRLNAGRSRYRSQLMRSPTAGGRVAAARALADVHAREALTLRSLELTGMARAAARAAVRSLVRAALAYRSLGAAADDGDRRGYAAARRSALAADAGIQRALRMLRVVASGS